MSGLGDLGTLTTCGRVFGSILANVGCESTMTRTGKIVPWISVHFVHFAVASRREGWYCDLHGGGRPLDLGAFRAFCGGKLS